MSGRLTRRDPLAPRWLGCTLPPQRAGRRTVATVTVENAGSATWRSARGAGLQLAYHWLDALGNPIVWDGERTPLPAAVGPGEAATVEMPVTAPRPPGRYTLAVDLVEEQRFWLEEIGCPVLRVEAEVAPRIERRLGVVVHGGNDPRTRAALAAQEEPLVDSSPEAVAHLVAGAEPDPGWSRRVLDAHAEGFTAVGVAVVPVGGLRERRSAARRLGPWAPGGGRSPRFEAPLLLPSILPGVEPVEHLGLPAYDGPDGLFDGRVAIRLPTRSGRPRA